MARREDLERKERLSAIVEAVDAGWLDWLLEDVTSHESRDISSLEFHVQGLPRDLRMQSAFAAAVDAMRAGYEYRRDRRRVPYGSRTGPAAKLKQITSPAFEHAREAAQLLGLDPPAPKSLETVVRRHQRRP